MRERRGEIGAVVSIDEDGQKGERRGERGMETWRHGGIEG